MAAATNVTVHVSSPTTLASCKTYSNTARAQANNHVQVSATASTIVQCPPPIHPGTIGFWRNWRNHYTSAQHQKLIDYIKLHNPKVYNAAGYPLTSAKVDAIYNYGSATPRDQQILGQLTALKFDLAVTQLDGTNGIVQKNDDICLNGALNVSSISGATAFFGTATPTVGQVVAYVEARWTGKLTTTRSDWKFNFASDSQRSMIINVLSGINEGTIITNAGCP